MNTKSFLSILALVVVLIAGGAFVYTKSTPSGQQNIVATIPVTTSAAGGQLADAASVTTSGAQSSKYKDGTYTATGDYAVPEGRTETIAVSVTLKGGLIVDSSVTGSARDHDSRRFEQQFISGYKAYVTGKSIDQANLGAVSGASLTGAGWNAALESIKSSAAV